MSITKTPTSMIDPTGATNGQVLTFNGSTSAWGASSLSANGFTASLSSNGYQKLPSGLIIQWGIAIFNQPSTNTDGPLTTFVYPIPFKSAVYSVQSMPMGGYMGGNIAGIITGTPNLTSCDIQMDASADTPAFSNRPAYVTVIGV
jgi:hypothetical protein